MKPGGPDRRAPIAEHRCTSFVKQDRPGVRIRRLPGPCLRFHVKHSGIRVSTAKLRSPLQPPGGLLGFTCPPLRASAAEHRCGRPIRASPEVSTRGGVPPSIACGFHVKHPAHPVGPGIGTYGQSCSTREQVELGTGRDPREEAAAVRPTGSAATAATTSGRSNCPTVEQARPARLRTAPAACPCSCTAHRPRPSRSAAAADRPGAVATVSRETCLPDFT